ncbi:MAG: SDR family oxidoreductase, partial [Acidobacteriota bacterium]|nr:SDR family oxidoreductase [Acidobacteriota bacterium]
MLITGAGGFIGRALCVKILSEGRQVRGTFRSESDVSRLPDGVEAFSIGSIGSDTKWDDALAGIDTVVHLAARVHVMDDSCSDPLAEYRKVNVEGTKCLAIAAANAGVKRFIFISSIKVNGEGREAGRKSDERQTSNEKNEELATDPHRLAQTFVRATCSGKNSHRFAKEKAEGRSDPYTEMDIPEPHDPYAVSKWEAEQVLRDVEADTGLEVVILRPPLVYGPGVKANFLRLVNMVKIGIPLPFGCIKNRRSLIYIGNLVDAIKTCMIDPHAAGKTYLVSDGEDVSTPELIRRIGAAFRRRALLLPVPVWIMRIAGRIVGKSNEVERLVGSLTVDISKIRK